MKALRLGILLALVCLTSVAPLPAQAGAVITQWCPMILTPFNGPGCHDYPTVQQAIDAAKLDGRPGTIYMVGGLTFAESPIADGLKGVTFQGGVGGPGNIISGGLTISHSSGITLSKFEAGPPGLLITGATGAYNLQAFFGSISIQNSNFHCLTVSDGVSTLPFVTGLTIQNGLGGPVTLTNVQASKCSASGAFLDMDSSSVTINQGSFNGNGGDGLHVTNQGGTIALNDIHATSNGHFGTTVTTPATVSVLHTITLGTLKSTINRFDYNGAEGLVINSGSDATLADVGTGHNGGSCGTCVVTATGSPFTLTTTHSKLNFFNYNAGDGLRVSAGGVITISDVNARGDGGYGATLDNTSTIAFVTLGTLHAKINQFDKNVSTGLKISTNGSIYAADLEASKNGAGGALLTNGGSVGQVTVSAVNSHASSFNGNTGTGLVVSNGGEITLTDVSASKNSLIGTDLSTVNPLLGVHVLTSLSKQNQFNSNGYAGLSIQSKRDVDIHNTTISKNGATTATHGLLLFVVNNNATLTCSTLKANNNLGINAGLGTGTLTLNSVVLSNPTNVFLSPPGVGPIFNTVACP